jgi:hypothetical protein
MNHSAQVVLHTNMYSRGPLRLSQMGGFRHVVGIPAKTLDQLCRLRTNADLMDWSYAGDEWHKSGGSGAPTLPTPTPGRVQSAIQSAHLLLGRQSETIAEPWPHWRLLEGLQCPQQRLKFYSFLINNEVVIWNSVIFISQNSHNRHAMQLILQNKLKFREIKQNWFWMIEP